MDVEPKASEEEIAQQYHVINVSYEGITRNHAIRRKYPENKDRYRRDETERHQNGYTVNLRIQKFKEYSKSMRRVNPCIRINKKCKRADCSSLRG